MTKTQSPAPGQTRTHLVLTGSESLYCQECKDDIPVSYFEDGSILIHCPRCIGECVTCDCHLALNCFQDVGQIRIIHPAAPTGSGK